MKIKLIWKKRIFSKTYVLFSNGLKIGALKNNNWNKSAEGILNEKKVRFITKGFFKKTTKIIDRNKDVEIGKITYNSWGTKAIIEYSGRKYQWKYTNLWHTRSTISDSENTYINYKGRSRKGKIELEKQNEILILAGLYIQNYLWQAAITLIITIYIFRNLIG